MSDSCVPRHRRGLFGGAFDPPHRGHAALIQCALETLQLDQLHVVPTGNPLHRIAPPTAAVHRLAMARLAFDDIAGVLVDDCEVLREGPTYTIDTLRDCVRRWPLDAWFLVLGEDQARAFTQWRAWSEIASLAIICVAVRADSSGLAGCFNIPPGYAERFLQLPMKPDATSATEIRTRSAAGARLDALVFPPVARYIADHHLYQTI